MAQPQRGSQEGRSRLRPDLWQAVFDYTSGKRYAWNVETSTASVTSRDAEGLTLPTLTRDELDGWRAGFVARHRLEVEPNVRAQLEHWRDGHLPTTLLPTSLQPAWNRELRDQAAERLSRWFDANGLEAPDDMLASVEAPLESAEIARLRQYIQSAVSRMTPTELQQLTLPASAAARTPRPEDNVRE
jgi:hypothetical protein